MNVTLILPSSNLIPDELLKHVVGIHRRQNIDNLEIIIVNWGERVNPDVIGVNKFYCVPDNGKVNVSLLRNLGAKNASYEWLIFSDINTVYKNVNCFRDMIDLASEGVIPVVAGRTRQDFLNRESQHACGYIYPCNHGPILVYSGLYFQVGGYCEKYSGWGYEDCDFSRKLGDNKILSYSSRGNHILEIHLCYMKSDKWLSGSENNRNVWIERTKLSIEQAITNDRNVLGLN